MDNDTSQAFAMAASTVNNLAATADSWRAREFAKEQNDIAWQRTVDAWNSANTYNSPSAQIQRLRDAGLNPLYYGLDGSSADAFEAPAQAQYQQAQWGAMSNPISVGTENLYKQAMIENTQADTAYKSQQSLTEVQKRENMSAEFDNLQQKLQNMKSEQKLTENQVAEIDKELEWIDRFNEANIARMESETALNDAQRDRIERLIDGEELLQAKTLEEFEYRFLKMLAEARKDNALAGLTETDIENYALNHMSNGLFGTGLSVQNLARSKRSKDNGKLTPEGEGSRKPARERFFKWATGDSTYTAPPKFRNPSQNAPAGIYEH